VFLADIVAAKLAQLGHRKTNLPLDELRKQALVQPPARSLGAALRSNDVKLVAEVKKASPSRGIICSDFDPVRIARAYATGGASAISVLTEERYFQGNLDYLMSIRDALGDTCPPLLRKDFILDPYQVYESRAYGADSLLLIVAILTSESLSTLLGLSQELGMDALVEVHNKVELEMALDCRARIIGINNRDLKTFSIDITTTQHLRPLIPLDRITVSESGIKTRDDIKRMKEWRVDAVLVGEALMSAPDVLAKMRELIGQS